MRWGKITILLIIALAMKGSFAQNLLPMPISTAPYYFNAQPMMYPQWDSSYSLPNYWQQQQPNFMSYMPMLNQLSQSMLDDFSGGNNYDSKAPRSIFDVDANGRIKRDYSDYTYDGKKNKRTTLRERDNITPTVTPTPTPAPTATVTPSNTNVSTTTIEEVYDDAQKKQLIFKVDDKNEDIDIELDATLHNVVAILADPSELGRGVALMCLAQNDRDVLATSASLGARRVLATMYQSCQALDPIIDGTKKVENSIVKDASGRRGLSSAKIETYLEQNMFSRGRVKPPPAGCFDLAKKPPVYGYGAKGKVNKAKGTIDLSFNQADQCQTSGISCQSSPLQAVDCSGFVAAALATQGLRMTVGQDTHPAWFGTSHFASASKKRNSCFADVAISDNLSIMPGDIISYSDNHVIMIDEVGPDPLGIKKFSAPGKNCNDIHYKDFDFTYLHSGSIGNYGPARVSSKYHERVPGTIFKTLRVKAIEACRKIQDGTPAVSVTQGKFGVIRHRGAAVDGCVGPAKPLEGEQCVASCFPARGQ